MTDKKVTIQREEFLQRNLMLSRNNDSFSREIASETSLELAKKIAEVIKSGEVSYMDINKAIIMIDNSFYDKTLRNQNRHIP